MDKVATVVEQIVSRALEAVIVYESPDVIAFADHDPINFGHILICPIKPYESFIDLPEPIHQEIQQVAKDLYTRLMNKFNPEGISFMQNNGECNELDHYHLHIFPRFSHDEFGWTSQDLGQQSIESLRQSLQGF